MQIKLSDHYFNYLQNRWGTIYESRHCLTVPGMSDTYIIYMFYRPQEGDWRWVVALTEQQPPDHIWYTDGIEMEEIWEEWIDGVRPEPCVKSDDRAVYLPQGISIYTNNPNPFLDTKGSAEKPVPKETDADSQRKLMITLAVLGAVGLIAFLWFMSRKKKR